MKKKLMAILLMCAMVVTLLPTTQAKAAGIAFLYNVKKPNVVLNENKVTSIYVGGARVNLSYYINGKDNVSGKWASSNTSVVKVSQKGSCKAVGNGIAYISFTYKEGGENKVLQCKLKAKTKATAVSLSPSVSGFTGTMKVGESVNFTATLTTNPKAKAVNPSIETTYGTYYALYADAACKTAASSSVAAVDAAGMVTANGVGTVYLKAFGKSTPTSTSGNVESVGIPITIQSPTTVKQIDSSKIKVTSNYDIQSVIVQNSNKVTVSQMSDTVIDSTKRSAVVTLTQTILNGTYTVIINGSESFTLTCEPAKPSKLAVNSSYAALDQNGASNGYIKAYIYYTLYDQFGNDITNSTYAKDYMYGFSTQAGQLEATEQGVMALKLPVTGTSVPKAGDTYDVKIFCAFSESCTYEGTVVLGSPSVVSKLEYKGIYTYQNSVAGYKKVADTTTNNIVAGTTIVPYNNSMETVGAYYVLIAASDQYGNVIARKGVQQSTVSVSLTDSSKTTNLSLATTESAGAVEIDGVRYLAYPISAGTTGVAGKGTVVLSVYSLGGGAVTQTYTIAEKAEIKDFIVNGQVTIKKSGSGYDKAGSQCSISYTVTNTANLNVTDFETLVGLTGGNAAAVETAKTIGKYYIPNTYISSSSGSQFWWQMKSDGTAELWYMPVFVPTVINNVVANFSEDKITTMKGTAYEKTSSIYQYVQQ